MGSQVRGSPCRPWVEGVGQSGPAEVVKKEEGSVNSRAHSFAEKARELIKSENIWGSHMRVVFPIAIVLGSFFCMGSSPHILVSKKYCIPPCNCP